MRPVQASFEIIGSETMDPKSTAVVLIEYHIP
jgi:hypothetical protein